MRVYLQKIYVYQFEDDMKHISVQLKKGCKSVTFRFHLCYRHGCHTANDEKHEHTPHKHTHTRSLSLCDHLQTFILSIAFEHTSHASSPVRPPKPIYHSPSLQYRPRGGAGVRPDGETYGKKKSASDIIH